MIHKRIIYLLFLLFLAVLTWSSVMTIESSVRSNGTVLGAENRKVVTHYEGGVIEEIFIKEGDEVIKEQPLMTINNLSIDEKNKQHELIVNSLSEKISRLDAEIKYKKSYKSTNNNVYAKREEDAFKIRRRELATVILIIKDRIKQKQIKVRELQKQKQLLSRQVKIFQEQESLLEKLVKREAASKNNVLAKENEVLNAKRQLNEVNFGISRIKTEIKEMENEILFEKSRYVSNAKKEYDEAFKEYRDSQTQLNVVRERRHRSLLISPHSGTVHKISANTLGETVKPGQILIEIVPDSRKLIVKAQIKAEDRDKIWNGMYAKVSPIFKDFRSNPIDGQIVQISADSNYDEQNQRRYFEVIIESDKFVKDQHKFIISGMMVDVSIITGEHQLLEYLLRPVLRGWQKSFTEPFS